MLYDRKIKYIHLYEKGVRVQNVGFVKLEMIEDKVNVHVHIAGLRRADKEECAVMVKGKGEKRLLGKMGLENGKGILDIREASADKPVEGLSYEEIEEISVELSMGGVLRCIIRESVEETVNEIVEVSLDIEKGGVVERALMPDNVGEEAECDLLPDGAEEAELLQETYPDNAGRPMVMAADKWQQLWALYPHRNPFGDEREFLVISPQDFVILQKRYYKLSANSFLLHGYYNYEHLIMCKVKRGGEEIFYIGVPGNFYEKEKQVALLFGFESFEGKRAPAGNGDFGYYMIPVEI